jgi:hypothetical protein
MHCLLFTTMEVSSPIGEKALMSRTYNASYPYCRMFNAIVGLNVFHCISVEPERCPKYIVPPQNLLLHAH